MSERILMNEFKTLSEEKWLNIEVGSLHLRLPLYSLTGQTTNTLSMKAPQGEYLQVEYRPDRAEQGVYVLRWLLQGSHDLSSQLPLPASK